MINTGESVYNGNEDDEGGRMKRMKKTMERKRGWCAKVFLTAAVVFCLSVMMSAAVLAAGTDVQIAFVDDVSIKGFMSQDPEQELHGSYSYMEGEIIFCLPASADTRKVRISFQQVSMDPATGAKTMVEQEGYVMINGSRVYSGDEFELPQNNETFTIGTGSGDQVPVRVLQSENIASMFIATKSGSMQKVDENKNNKESGDLFLIRADGTVDYNGPLKQIKGRGNATWLLPKKPYNIKLDESVDFLGLGKAKGWCLLANYLDGSLLRNKIVYNLADETGIPFTMASESIDLYTNGNYQGTYLLTEKVEINKNRVNITDLGKATEKVNTDELENYSPGGESASVANTMKWVNIPNNPEDITGGYLIELELNERYKAEACGFVTSRGQSVTMKEPEFVSEAQITYIRDFYQDMEDALYSKDGYNAKGKHFSEYLDEESAAKMYLLQEYSLNLDSGITSFYLYKDSDKVGDGKLHMAPVWDFDVALGNHQGRDNVDLTNARVWWANQAQIYNIGGLNLMAQAVQHESVQRLVVEQWNEVFLPAVQALLGQKTDYVPGILRTLTEYENEIKSSADMNFRFWPSYVGVEQNGTGVYTGDTFEARVQYVRKFLTEREDFMDQAFAYTTNKYGYQRIKGEVSIEGTMKSGETITAKVADSNSKTFIYQWLADGEKIAGAVESSYVLKEEDAGKVISVQVRSEDDKLLASLDKAASGPVEGTDPDPGENPGENPDPNPGENPDPNPGENPDPNPGENPDPNPGENPDPNPGENPDQGNHQNPGGDHSQTGTKPVPLSASAVTKVSSTAKGVKIVFTRSENAAVYEIYRRTGSTYTKIGTTKELSFTDTAPVGGKKMAYAVKAVSADKTRYTDAAYGTELTIQLPKAPKKLKAKAQKGKKVSLSWTKVKGASAYLIYRCESKNGTYRLAARVKKQNTVKYTDYKKLKKNKKYYYRIAVLQNGKYSPMGKAVWVAVKG